MGKSNNTFPSSSLLSPVHICLRSANSVPAVEAINIGGAATWGNMLLIKQQLLYGGAQWTTRRYALRPSLMDWRGHLYPRRGKYGVFSLTKIECWPQLFSHFCLKKSRSLPLSLSPSLPLTRPTSLLPSFLMNGKLKLNFSSFLVSPVAVGQPNRQGKLPRGDLHSCRRRRFPPSSSCRVAFVGNSGRCRGDGTREIKR